MLTVTFLLHLKQMLIAYLLAFPIGWDRERESRGAGLRTFPLVCLASCGMVILGRDTLGGNANR
jgi:putative Mg2+ transporter-C (MgtC) family protein